MDLQKLVASQDESDLRLAAHLFLSDELDPVSHDAFMERLQEPHVAERLAEAVQLLEVGGQVNRPVPRQVATVVDPAASPRWGTWVAVGLAIALLMVVSLSRRGQAKPEQTQRVAELWVGQFGQSDTGLEDWTAAIAEGTAAMLENGMPGGDSHGHAAASDNTRHDNTHHDNTHHDNVSSAAHGSPDAADDAMLAPPSWMLTALLQAHTADVANDGAEQNDSPGEAGSEGDSPVRRRDGAGA